LRDLHVVRVYRRRFPGRTRLLSHNEFQTHARIQLVPLHELPLQDSLEAVHRMDKFDLVLVVAAVAVDRNRKYGIRITSMLIVDVDAGLWIYPGTLENQRSFRSGTLIKFVHVNYYQLLQLKYHQSYLCIDHMTKNN
jgi:hypothetical protein